MYGRRQSNGSNNGGGDGDDWIWGNTRGGGGAPLKDARGNEVTNLKKVLTGEVQVDHSPSPGKARMQKHQQSYSNGYDDNEVAVRDDSGGGRRTKHRKNSPDAYDDREESRLTGSMRNLRIRGAVGVNDDEDPNQDRVIPGLNDMPMNSPRNRHQYQHQHLKFNLPLHEQQQQQHQQAESSNIGRNRVNKNSRDQGALKTSRRTNEGDNDGYPPLPTHRGGPAERRRSGAPAAAAASGGIPGGGGAGRGGRGPGGQGDRGGGGGGGGRGQRNTGPQRNKASYSDDGSDGDSRNGASMMRAAAGRGRRIRNDDSDSEADYARNNSNSNRSSGGGGGRGGRGGRGGGGGRVSDSAGDDNDSTSSGLNGFQKLARKHQRQQHQNEAPQPQQRKQQPNNNKHYHNDNNSNQFRQPDDAPVYDQPVSPNSPSRNAFQSNFSLRFDDNTQHHGNTHHSRNNDVNDHNHSPQQAGQQSPKKFMGAIKELTQGYDPDQEVKMRKKMEYQRQLQEQIDEKKRKKEKEMRELDEIKRKELQEYLEQNNMSIGTINPVSIPSVVSANNNNSSRDASFDDNNRYNDNDSSFRPPPNSNNKFNPNNPNRIRDKNQRSEEADDTLSSAAGPGRMGVNKGYQSEPINRRNNNNNNNNNHDNNPPLNRKGHGDEEDEGVSNTRYRGGRGGMTNNVYQDDVSSYASDDNYGDNGGDDYSDAGAPKRAMGGGRGKDVGDDGEYVPVQEYDQLSKLCDKLLTQQDQLQSEIQKQSEELKAMKRGAGAAGLRNKQINPQNNNKNNKFNQRNNQTNNRHSSVAARAGASALGVSPSKVLNRSKSAVQNRISETDPSSDKNRPNSMNRGVRAAAAGNLNNDAVSGQQKTQNKSARPPPKPAFGSNSDMGTRLSVKRAENAQSLAEMNAEKRRERIRARNSAQESDGIAAVGRGSQAKGKNGFQKLQSKNPTSRAAGVKINPIAKIKGGPVMVSHEETDFSPQNPHKGNHFSPSPPRGGGGGGGGRGGGGGGFKAYNHDNHQHHHRSSHEELEGVSEYLPMHLDAEPAPFANNNNNGRNQLSASLRAQASGATNKSDLITGDQLDKLLNQAKHTRS